MISTKPQPYFETPKTRTALVDELKRWKGTPFQDRIGRNSKPGVGADCVGFVAAVLRRMGAVDSFQWPVYTINGGAAMLNVLLDTLNQIAQLEIVVFGPALAPLDASCLLPGDVLVISNGKITHVCLFAGGKSLWHCWGCCGVVEGSVEDPLAKRCTRAVYRPIIVS